MLHAAFIGHYLPHTRVSFAFLPENLKLSKSMHLCNLAEIEGPFEKVTYLLQNNPNSELCQNINFWSFFSQNFDYFFSFLKGTSFWKINFIKNCLLGALILWLLGLSCNTNVILQNVPNVRYLYIREQFIFLNFYSKLLFFWKIMAVKFACGCVTFGRR